MTRLRKEAARYRNDLRVAETRAAEVERLKAEALEQETKRRTDAEKAMETERQRATRLETEASEARKDSRLQMELIRAGVRQDAVEDALKLFPRTALKLKDDGTLDQEPLKPALDSFKTEKVFLFGSASPAAPARGLPGLNPPQTGSSKMPITEPMKEDARKRGLSPEEWRDILEKVEAKKAELARRPGTTARA